MRSTGPVADVLIAAPAGPPATVQRSAALGRLQRPVTLKLATGLLILAMWELGVQLFAPDYVARPSRMVPKIPAVLGDSAFLSGAWQTISAVVLGMAIALVAGTVLGLVMGRVRDVDRFLKFYVNSLYAMPMVALIPLITLVFGYSSQARLVTVILAAILPIVFNVAEGARSVPREYLDVAQAYQARWWHVWFGITIPSSLPYVLAGVHLASGRALVSAVVAEYLTSIDGLGFYILFNSRSFHQDEAAVAVLVLAAFGTLLYICTGRVTRRLMPWYRREEH